MCTGRNRGMYSSGGKPNEMPEWSWKGSVDYESGAAVHWEGRVGRLRPKVSRAQGGQRYSGKYHLGRKGLYSDSCEACKELEPIGSINRAHVSIHRTNLHLGVPRANTWSAKETYAGNLGFLLWRNSFKLDSRCPSFIRSRRENSRGSHDTGLLTRRRHADLNGINC